MLHWQPIPVSLRRMAPHFHAWCRTPAHSHTWHRTPTIYDRMAPALPRMAFFSNYCVTNLTQTIFK